MTASNIILKSRSKSLQSEAQYLRYHENRLKNDFHYKTERQDSKGAKLSLAEREKLNWMRRHVLRKEAFATFIVRAILRDRPREDVISNLRKGTYCASVEECILTNLEMVEGCSRKQAEERLNNWLG